MKKLKIIKAARLLAVFILLPAAVMAQLSPDDIAEMRKEIEKNGWSFTVDTNPATKYPLEQLCGAKPPKNWKENARSVTFTEKRDLPERFDWRDSSGCTPIKNQGSCGSCWAFGTIGVLECNIKIIDGITVDLSEQWLVDCNREGMSCYGGWFAFDYFMGQTDLCDSTGAVSESVLPYIGWGGTCDCPYRHNYMIDNWAFVDLQEDMPPVDEIKQAIMDYGPVGCAVTTSSYFQGYNDGVFSYDAPFATDHIVALVGWDDTMGTNGVWILRNSWGTGWGEDGYMYIEYGVSQVGVNACFIEYPGAQRVTFSYPEGIPAFVNTGIGTEFEVTIDPLFGEPVPGTGKIHYTIDEGTPVTQPMTPISDNHYSTTLPAIECGDLLEYHLSVEDTRGNICYDPDPSTPRTPVIVTSSSLMYEDNFELNEGWTVTGDASDGHWDRGVPAGDGSRGDPTEDYDGSGQCFLTDNVLGNSDVDYGSTYLISPLFDLTGKKAIVSYALWFCNDASGTPDDPFRVYLSDDDGQNWVVAEEIAADDAASSGGWYLHSFFTDQFITSSDQMRIRFEASDLANSSCVEAAVDAVTIHTYTSCSPYDCGNTNCSDIPTPDISDIVRLIDFLYLSHEPLCCDITVADVNGSGGNPDISDIVHLIAHMYLDGRALACP